MKKLSNKTLGKDKGIAIIFSLVMLMIFFLLAFGFLAVTTSASDANKVRNPSNSAELIAATNLLTQATRGLEATEGLLTNANAFLIAPNPQKLFKIQFQNPNSNSPVDVPFYCWGTNENHIPAPATLVEDALKMNFEAASPSNEYQASAHGIYQ